MTQLYNEIAHEQQQYWYWINTVPENFFAGEKENTWQVMQKRVISKIDNAIA